MEQRNDMRYLLYGVLGSAGRRKPPLPRGVAGGRLFLVNNHRLSAAVSAIRSSDLVPTASRVWEYEKALESIYRRQAVVPLRYGTVFGHKRQLIGLLQERGRKYEALLRRIDGCVEMGIRAFLPRRPKRRGPAAHLSGAAYLTAQRERHAGEARLALEQEITAKKISGFLSGLFRRCKREFGFLAGRRCLSLHFLVPKKALSDFRKRFVAIEADQESELFLSGPWPPFNFVE
jgi:hypothetical protein